jgi:ubiquinone/menaquinone biosynthesis C-methylase UbiE
MTDKHLYKNKKFEKNPALNYERYFVPVIGKPLAEDLINLAKLKPGENVLDVACGTGIVARLASEKVGPRGSVAGLDLNPGMLAVAREITENDKSIEWYETGAESIPLPDDSFDVVLCQMGLQFMEDKIVALKEILRVLKPRGRLLLNVPGPRQELFSIMAKAIKENLNAQAEGFVNAVFSLYDINQIQSLFKQAGFKDLNIKEYQKKLDLPQAQEFLWQYIHSTPLAGFVEQADEKNLLAFEKEVTRNWQDFVYNGGMRYKQRMVQVIARKN